MNRIIIFLVLCSVICSSCARRTAKELRGDYSHHSRFEVEDSIQIVIKNIRNKTNECTWHFPEYITMLDELGEAQIEYRRTIAMSGDVLCFLVDLNRQNDKTRVDIYGTHFGEDAVRILEYGAKGLPGCP
jgi:hypothetical protein